MAVSKRLRYEVFRRDDFTCRYCGAKAPDVQLRPDHVIPVALGGSDDPSNLVTACEACNGGKTSTTPDAPLVAEVADRALEWAQAMQQAQAKMLADIKARDRDRTQFGEWWDGWHRGEGKDRTPIPKDPAWWVTVDQLIVAGLPPPVLKGCIDLAMTQRKVQDENRFRYMCGVAWNKVKEMHAAARAITSGAAPEDQSAPGSDPFDDGRLSLARELLDEISEEERTYFLESADLTGWQDEDDEPQTESQHAGEAVSSLLNSARCNVDWLVERIRKTLKNLPPEIGGPCLAEMDGDTTIRDPLSRMAWQGVNALLALEDLIHLPAAATYINGLPEEEAREWLLYADSLYGADLSPERLLVRAMDCAKAVKDGKHWDVMCLGPGEHIRRCPSRATRYLRFDGPECCRDADDDHDRHRFCERHAEEAIAGELNRGGEPVTVLSSARIDKRATAEVPF